MSNAVTATGILIKRGLIVPPTAVTLTAGPTVNTTGVAIMTAAGHGLSVGDEVVIAAVTGSTPAVNGQYVVQTVISSSQFTITLVVSVAGSGWGTCQQLYAAVGELKEVIPGGISRNKIETSTHNDGAESHVLGILRHTDPGMKINYIGTNTTHIAILADLLGNVKNNWMIKFPSGTSRVGLGYVQQFTFDPVPVDAEQAATIAITYSATVTEVGL